MKKNSLWTMPFIMVIVINAVNAISSYMVNPAFPDYLVSKGAAFEITGLVSSLLSWIALAFRPFSGAASDRFNKKIMMLGAYLIIAVCMLGYSVSNSVTPLVILRIIHGMAFAVSGTVSMAFATTFIPASRLGEGISYLSLGTLIGNMIGPQLGAIIADAFATEYCFMIAGGLCVICMVIIIFLPYRWERTAAVRRVSFSDFFAWELVPEVFLIGVFSFGNGIISYYIRGLGKLRGIENISIFFTVYSVTLLFIKPFVGQLQDKKGVNFILYPAYVLYAAAMVIMANAYSLIPVIIAAVLKAAGQGSGTPAIQAESVRKLGVERSGVASSMCYIGQDLGNGLGPIYASLVIEKMGYGFVFNSTAVLLLIALAMLMIRNRSRHA